VTLIGLTFINLPKISFACYPLR